MKKSEQNVPLNIVLVEPEIPQNTGNIARTCAVTGSSLHLVKPLGFSIEDKYVKRAGLDYWDLLDLHFYESLDDFLEQHRDKRLWMLSTKAKRTHSEISYQPGDFLLFGKETKGLPESLLHNNYDHALRIPMRQEARSLNLSNAVAIVLYEAMRQMDYMQLETEGALTEFNNL